MILELNSDNPLRNEPQYLALKDHVIRTTGLAYYENRDHELAAKIVERMDRLNLRGCDAYLHRLTAGATGRQELDHLIKLLTIGETYFFRHRELFEATRRYVIPSLIEHNRASRRLHIWSAGCSTGAEAYSISIMLNREFADRLRGWDVSIVGSDINRSFLARAAEACYDDWALRGLSPQLQRTCFSRVGQRWALKDQFKKNVSFRYDNLAEPSLPAMQHGVFDVIFCRNVMIYFNEEIIERIVRHAHHCLPDGGWFLVGHAEHSLERFREFQMVNCDGATLYQRSNAPAPGAGSCEENDNSGSHSPSRMSPLATGSIDHSSASEASRNGTRISSEAAKIPDTHETAGPAIRGELAPVRTLADRGEFDAAAEQCERLLKKYPLHALCHFYRGLVHDQLGQYPQAERSLRRAIYLDRSLELGHYYLGMTLQRLGRYEQASRSLRNALKLLAERDADELIDESDGLSVARLTELTLMQLDAAVS